MHDDEVMVDQPLVRALPQQQIPDLVGLALTAVEPWGADIAIWRLGDDLVVRLPRIGRATGQVPRDRSWLPVLAPARIGRDPRARRGRRTRLRLPLGLGAAPVAAGRPGSDGPDGRSRSFR